MQVKEIKIVMYFCLENMPEIKTKSEIADKINNVIYEHPELFGELTEENIIDVREYEVKDE
jgi:hypothetical protein